MGQVQGEVRRNREVPSPPTNSVGTEILASHIHDDHLRLSTVIERDGIPIPPIDSEECGFENIKTIDLFFS
jgi:hypothetical protein